MGTKPLKIIKKNFKKYRTNAFFKAKFVYTKFYETLSVEENTVLVQSYGATGINGSPFYIVKELCNNPDYADLSIFVVAKKDNENSILELLQKSGCGKVKTVIFNSSEYCKLLASAKYLINNSTFPTYYIKKPGQIYLNTWHGTPLKALGRQIKNAPNEIGNTQRNFIMSDYLLYPNKFTFEAMKRDYMLGNFFKGEYILSGYPRNEIFFDSASRERIIEEMGLEGKKIIVFMPTWKGSLVSKNIDEQIVYAKHALYEMDAHLDDDTVVFVKLHSLVTKGLNFNSFKRIFSVPAEYETYEFLNAADCLVTDYSSVFWDFANTGKKIVLYAYDFDKYLSEKGMYIDMKTLPFPIVYNSAELINELKNLDDYKPYKEELSSYLEYDSPDASKKLCAYIFAHKKSDGMDIIKGSTFANDKENVLMFAGALLKNGITTAFKNLVSALNSSGGPERNYIITFYQKRVEQNKSVIFEFANNDYIVIQGPKDVTLFEAVIQFLFLRLNIKTKHILKIIKRINAREIKRVYPGIDFSYCINFSGYESGFFNMSYGLDCKKFVWVHNNMYAEADKKQNFHINSLKLGYSEASKIAVVRESLKEELASYVKPSERNKLCVVHNQNDIEGIKAKAELPIEFNDDTFCSVSLSELEAVLDSDCEKFINIARFSVEKGLDQLISAFAKYRSETNPDAYLIIVGGYGKEFQKTLELAEELGEGHIIIVKSISNPYPILKKCGAFVLSSHYEGLPMTIIEALILGVPVFSTNIPGPREFLEKGYGTLVEDSENGIIDGFKAYHNGTLKASVEFDAEEFNRNALKEYYSLFDD